MIVLINGTDLAYQSNLEVTNESIDVTPMIVVEPDMGWTYRDPEGHFHAFSDDKDNNLPTLDRLQQEHEHSEPPDEDGWTETWTTVEITWLCRICRAVVTPKWLEHASTHRTQIPGRMSWRVELRVVGENAVTISQFIKKQVSVQVFNGDGTCAFGVGLLTELGASRAVTNDQRKWFGCVYGNGPLGIREVT